MQDDDECHHQDDDGRVGPQGYPHYHVVITSSDIYLDRGGHHHSILL